MGLPSISLVTPPAPAMNDRGLCVEGEVEGRAGPVVLAHGVVLILQPAVAFLLVVSADAFDRDFESAEALRNQTFNLGGDSLFFSRAITFRAVPEKNLSRGNRL